MCSFSVVHCSFRTEMKYLCVAGRPTLWVCVCEEKRVSIDLRCPNRIRRRKLEEAWNGTGKVTWVYRAICTECHMWLCVFSIFRRMAIFCLFRNSANVCTLRTENTQSHNKLCIACIATNGWCEHKNVENMSQQNTFEIGIYLRCSAGRREKWKRQSHGIQPHENSQKIKLSKLAPTKNLCGKFVSFLLLPSPPSLFLWRIESIRANFYDSPETTAVAWRIVKLKPQ